MGDIAKMKIDEMNEEKGKNFKERIWFIKYWAEYIKTHSDREWSKGQNVLIDSQIKSARESLKGKV